MIESDSVDVLVLPHVLEFEAEPHEALRECVEATGDAAQCDQANFAVGSCTDDCREDSLSDTDRDAAFALYLCDTDPDSDGCDWD